LLKFFKSNRSDAVTEEAPEIHGSMIVQPAMAALSGKVDFSVAI
jgi:hypothetical protein